jgi:hypothetical protein
MIVINKQSSKKSSGNDERFNLKLKCKNGDAWYFLNVLTDFQQ